MKTLNYYKQYAKRCILENRINTRAFDNCFENGQGAEVVKYIVRQALQAPKDLNFIGEIMHSEYKKKAELFKLKNNLVSLGMWGEWLYFYNNGYYPTFNN